MNTTNQIIEYSAKKLKMNAGYIKQKYFYKWRKYNNPAQVIGTSNLWTDEQRDSLLDFLQKNTSYPKYTKTKRNEKK